MNDFNVINDLKQKKENLHKKIDDNISNIIKHLGNLFESVKFNENQNIEDNNNLELLTNVDCLALKLNDLLKLIYDMKADCLKRAEFSFLQRKEHLDKVKDLIKELNLKFSVLQENYNFINVLVKEMKLSKFYRYSLNYK